MPAASICMRHFVMDSSRSNMESYFTASFGFMYFGDRKR